MCSDKDVIFVIGQPSKPRLSKWLEDTFEIKDENLNESSFRVKIRNKTVEINIEFCNFNRISFDENKFVTFCQKEESNIKAIISIQNCNPRPQTIVEDISKLRRVFTAKDLKKKLYIFAITDENKEEIGNRILSDNLGFNNLLKLEDQKTKDAYKNNKIILLNQEECKQFKNKILEQNNDRGIWSFPTWQSTKGEDKACNESILKLIIS